MIEVHSKMTIENPPGVRGCVAEARLIDKSKGTKVTENGLEVWAWDKVVVVTGEDRGSAESYLDKEILNIKTGEEQDA